jgi:hypothetical protein
VRTIEGVAGWASLFAVTLRAGRAANAINSEQQIRDFVMNDFIGTSLLVDRILIWRDERSLQALTNITD